MPSNFECVGFRIDNESALMALVQQVLPQAQPLGSGPRRAETYRWQDQSGARLVIERRGEIIHNVLPSFAGSPGAQLANVQSLNDDTSAADVVDENGELITRLALDLEERALIAGSTVGGQASLAALVGQVSIHPDPDAFAASPASLLDDSGAPGPAPPEVAQRGLAWPPRMGPESFISLGVFGDSRNARPIARLNGIVIETDERTNSLTGLRFVRSRVRTAGFEADICAPTSELGLHLVPGNVLAGLVYMVGSLHDWTVDTSSRSGWGSRLLGRLRTPTS